MTTGPSKDMMRILHDESYRQGYMAGWSDAMRKVEKDAK